MVYNIDMNVLKLFNSIDRPLWLDGEKENKRKTIVIQKHLCALEIINDFGVNVGYIKYYFHKGNGGYNTYKSDMKFPYLDFYPSEKMLEYEDFKLLREVLK